MYVSARAGSRKRAAVSSVAAVVVSFASCAALLGCGPTGRNDRSDTASDASIDTIRPESIAYGDTGTCYFTSIAEMAATADLVVEAHVVGLERGRQTGAEAGDPGIGLRDSRLAVDRVLKGTAQETIWLEEYGFDRYGQPFEVANYPWSTVGDKGIFFLSRTAPHQPADHYQLTNADGRILFSDGETETFGISQLSSDLRAVSPDAARNLVLAGVEEARVRRLPPQAPYSVLKRPAALDSPHHQGETGAGDPGAPTPEGSQPSP